MADGLDSNVIPMHPGYELWAMVDKRWSMAWIQIAICLCIQAMAMG
jgi:hypothetical protein